jgi:predicted MFS family arabinose efflux permease
MPIPTQFVLSLGSLGVLCVPLLFVTSPAALAIALALPGLAIAPFMVLSSVLAESRVPPAVLTQAFTWLNSGSAAGIALGAALAGNVVDAHEPRRGFTLALLAAATATIAAAAARSTGGSQES